MAFDYALFEETGKELKYIILQLHRYLTAQNLSFPVVKCIPLQLMKSLIRNIMRIFKSQYFE